MIPSSAVAVSSGDSWPSLRLRHGKKKIHKVSITNRQQVSLLIYYLFVGPSKMLIPDKNAIINRLRIFIIVIPVLLLLGSICANFVMLSA